MTTSSPKRNFKQVLTDAFFSGEVDPTIKAITYIDYPIDRVPLMRESGFSSVWVGSSSAPFVKCAAKFGDTWLSRSHLQLVTLQELFAVFNEDLQVLGKSTVPRPLPRNCMVAESETVVEERFTEAFNANFKALGTWSILKEVVAEQHTSGDGELPPGRAIVRNPATFISQFKRYFEIDFNELIFLLCLPRVLQNALSGNQCICWARK